MQGLGEAWRRTGIQILPTAAWTGAIILAVTFAVWNGASWLSTNAFGVPVGLWAVFFGAAAAARMTRRTPGSKRPAWTWARTFDTLKTLRREFATGSTTWRGTNIRVVPSAVCAATAIFAVSGAIWLGADWLGLTFLNVTLGMWFVLAGVASGAYFSRADAETNDPIRDAATSAFGRFFSFAGRGFAWLRTQSARGTATWPGTRILVFSSSVWAAAVMLTVSAAVWMGADWLGFTFAGMTLGMWLVIAGVGFGAYMSQAPARSRRQAETQTLAETGEAVLSGINSLRRTLARAISPDHDGTNGSGNGGRAVLDFDPPGPAPRERVPRRREKAAASADKPAVTDKAPAADGTPRPRRPRTRRPR